MPSASDTPPYTRKVWIAIAIVGAVAVLAWTFAFLLTGVLIIFAGLVLGVFFYHLSAWVARVTSLSYGSSFALTMFLLLLCSATFLYAAGNQIAERVEDFVTQLNAALTQLASQIEQHRWLKQFGEWATGDKNSSLPSTALSATTSAMSNLLTWIGGLVVILFLGFYFALQPELYKSGFVSLFPKSQSPRIASILEQSSFSLWKWILGRLIGMAVITVASAIGLWAIGIPMPITLGLLAGLMNFVPNIGPLISGIPPLLFSFEQGGYAAIYVIALYVILQFLESYFLTPLITQHQVAIPPGVTLSAQLLFGMLAGFLGLLLATPIVVVAAAVINETKEPAT